MALTKTERSTLILLYRILEKLEPKEKKFFTNAVGMLENGYLDMWESEYAGHLSDPLSRENVEYVYNVLDMYRWLQDSYKALSPADKKKVDAPKIIFGGFDGNNETELMAFARFLMEKMDRWSDLNVVAGLNTHHQTKHMYSAMLQKLPERNARALHLSAEEINNIFA